MLLLSGQAFADILIEPYVGYGSFKNKGDVTLTNLPAPGSPGVVPIDSKEKGAVFGGKLGVTFGMFGIGVEYTGGSLKDEDGDKTKVTDMGAFVRVGLPIGNIHASYFFKHEIKDDDFATYNGKGAKIGFGVGVLPFLDVNLDYITSNIDEIEFVDKANWAASNIDFDTTGFMLSISLPLFL